jgi:phage-related protein (TIGR01555 family)
MGKIQKGEVRNKYGRAGKPKPKKFGDSRMTDGWKNVQRGLGMGRDAKTNTFFQPANYKSTLQAELNALYTQSWIGRKVVDIPIDDAMRGGVIIEHDDPSVVDAVEKKMSEMKLHKKIDSMTKWSRVFGSSIMVVVAGDDDIKEPPKLGMNDLSNFAVLDRFEVSGMNLDINPLSKDYLCHQGYLVSKSGEVHPDRVFKMDGVDTTNWTRQKLNGWGLSIFESGFDAIQMSQSSTELINNLLFVSNVDYYKVKGLNEALSDGNDKLVQARIEVAQNMKSILNGVALDADDDYINVAKSFGGLNEINMGMLSLVAAAFSISATRLLEKSPDGMNATGEGDRKNYYDMVKSIQETDIRDAYEWALKFISYDLFGEDKNLTVTFPPLFQMSEAQRADLAFKNAQTDQINMNNGTVSPLECRRRLAEDETYPSITMEVVAKEEEEAAELELDNIEIGGDDADVSLNGAQVEALLKIVGLFKSGEIERQTAEKIIVSAFPVSIEQAKEVLANEEQGSTSLMENELL